MALSSTHLHKVLEKVNARHRRIQSGHCVIPRRRISNTPLPLGQLNGRKRSSKFKFEEVLIRGEFWGIWNEVLCDF